MENGEVLLIGGYNGQRLSSRFKFSVQENLVNMMSNGGSEEVHAEHSLEDASLSGDMKPDFFSGSTMAIR